MQERKILVVAGGIAAVAVLAFVTHFLIRLFTPVAVILPDGGVLRGHVFPGKPVALLIRNNFDFSGLDEIVPGDEPGIYHLRRPVPVTFRGPDGFTRLTMSTASTVGEFLQRAGIEMGPLDIIAPSLDTPLPETGEVRLTRVERYLESRSEVIPFHSILEVDEDLPRGQERIIVPGADGKKKVTYQVIIENGNEVDRRALAENILSRATPQRSFIGVKRERVADRQLTARRLIWMEATAYDPGPESNGPFTGMPTAYGLKVGRGVVAVDPHVIPLGTRLYIEGYGYAIAGDTGGAIKGMRIDLGYNTRDEAIRFGRRDVKVYILG